MSYDSENDSDFDAAPVAVPDSYPGAGEERETSSRTVAFKAKKIVLVIDDDPDILELATSALERLDDVRTIMAPTAKEAVALLKRFPVDAILTDIQLPEMTGLELLAHIRSLGFATPFVLMSGHVDRERAIQATRLGVIDILEKPFGMAVLREALVRALKVGSVIRRVHDDFRKFCDHRKLDPQYVDILSYMGIFLAQEEQRRFKDSQSSVPTETLAPIDPIEPEIAHEFDAFTYTGVPDLDGSSDRSNKDEKPELRAQLAKVI